MYNRDVFPIIDYVLPSVAVLQWSGFTNQPAGDGVEVISDSASDTGKCTIYGITTDGTVKYETITLNGITAVSTAEILWANIYGIFLGDANGKNITPAVGTIIVREASGNLTITTLAATAVSKGTIAFDFKGQPFSIEHISNTDNMWINQNTLATSTNGYPLGNGEKLQLSSVNTGNTQDFLWLTSDGTGSSAKIIVYKFHVGG